VGNCRGNLVFTDLMIKPEDNILKVVLRQDYKLYNCFIGKLNERNLFFEWNYYRITSYGKTWLCKIKNKKETICWLSIWDNGFNVDFHFTEKTISGINWLEINEEIKNMAKEVRPVRKIFFPISLLIKNREIFNDVIKILDYKISLK
jgi:hypothetical protein